MLTRMQARILFLHLLENDVFFLQKTKLERMPQLDKVTFLSQYFWLCIFYIGFYFVMYKYFLPKMSRVLKLRKKKCTSAIEATQASSENEKTRASYASILTQSFHTSRSAFHDVFVANTKFVASKLSQLNKTHCQSLNIAYISSLGQSALSQQTVLQHAALPLSSKMYFAVMLSKLSSQSFPSAKHIPSAKYQTIPTNEKKSDSLKSSKKK